MRGTRRSVLVLLLLLGGQAPLWTTAADAASASEINRGVDQALRTLYAAQPKARELGQRAKAVLVLPWIIKAGLLVGGMGGDGALRINGKTESYYNIAAASFGLQAGGQKFSYALFFMTDDALNYLRTSNGWAVGSGPSVVVVDKGTAASITSATLTNDVYAIPFGQKGLMAGLGLEGSKITRIVPKP
jgi:lipid-binding SYLF domain-containing protein